MIQILPSTRVFMSSALAKCKAKGAVREKLCNERPSDAFERSSSPFHRCPRRRAFTGVAKDRGGREGGGHALLGPALGALLIAGSQISSLALAQSDVAISPSDAALRPAQDLRAADSMGSAAQRPSSDQAAPLVSGAVRVVNINSDNALRLAEGLRGVGTSKAEAIVRYREQFGPFESVDELSEVSGIGAATVARNRDLIRLE